MARYTQGLLELCLSVLKVFELYQVRQWYIVSLTTSYPLIEIVDCISSPSANLCRCQQNKCSSNRG